MPANIYYPRRRYSGAWKLLVTVCRHRVVAHRYCGGMDAATSKKIITCYSQPHNNNLSVMVCTIEPVELRVEQPVNHPNDCLGYRNHRSTRRW